MEDTFLIGNKNAFEIAEQRLMHPSENIGMRAMSFALDMIVPGNRENRALEISQDNTTKLAIEEKRNGELLFSKHTGCRN